MKHVWRRFRPRNTPALDGQGSSAELLETLLAKTPGAVRAQRAMDEHPGGYHTNKARLYELIDFNDTFVSLALTLTLQERRGFIERLKRQMDEYCERVGSPRFSDEQYEAITRGLSREVAVYLGAKRLGYDVSMTSRTQDALGVDMVITDRRSAVSINIDCKTASAYHFRLKDLVQQGRLGKDQALLAEEQGYAHEVNGSGAEATAIVLLRIDPNETGDIVDFEFSQPALLGSKLQSIFENE